LIRPAEAGRLVNQLRVDAELFSGVGLQGNLGIRHERTRDAGGHIGCDPALDVDRFEFTALEVRATQPGSAASSRALTEPLTAAEQRILTLLPTSTYLQIADTLYISRNTVKTHLRSIYQKLGVASRSEALERAVDLRLL